VAARRQVCYLPGELRLYENMTGRQLVHFLVQLRGQKVNRTLLADLAQRLEIDLDRPIVHLSSGMKRKVALMQVLVPHAPLLVLDEPTNTLDPTMRDELLEQLRQARHQGQAVLFSSHVLSEVEKVCDRVGILQRGRLVHVQQMDTLRQGRLIQACLGGREIPLPEIPGLHLRERRNGRIIWEQTGPLQPVLDWLAHQPLTDLRVEPLGLSAIYHRYHGAET
jgi:ABC-2 type transport system ATP-binding protein